MKNKLSFDVFKYVGNVKEFNLVMVASFSNIESAMQCLSKHLNRKGLISPTYFAREKVFNSLEEFELENEEIELGV